jgi:PAS domain-containing protein
VRVREAQRRALVDNLEDVVWLKDRNSRYVLANPAFAGVCGRWPDAALVLLFQRWIVSGLTGGALKE